MCAIWSSCSDGLDHACCVPFIARNARARGQARQSQVRKTMCAAVVGSRWRRVEGGGSAK